MENDKHFILDVRLRSNSSLLTPAVSGFAKMDFSLGDYLITLLRHASSPNRLILNTDRRTGLYLDGYLLSDGDSLTSSEILTSLLEKHSEVDQIMLGIYNLIILDADTRSVQIYNDALGSFPCYYLVLPSRLLISNSLWLLKQYIPLEINEQGFLSASHSHISQAVRRCLNRFSEPTPACAIGLNWITPFELLRND